MKYKERIKLSFATLIITLFNVSGCTTHYISNYDPAIKNEIIEVSKKIDIFWGALFDVKPSKRKYDKFKIQYNQIEADIRVLVIKNEIRSLNRESIIQANIALDLWIEDRALHKKNDTFSDFQAKRHRKQFNRVFTAMAKGEEAKNISASNEGN